MLLRSRTMRATAALLLTTATAQGNQLDLSWSGGVLDWTWSLEVEGQPLEPYLLIPSFEAGPTPLALFDRNDPRLLDVGLDLLPLARTGLLDRDGVAGEDFALVADPALVGVDIRAQAVELLNGSACFGELSQPVSARLTGLGDAVSTQGAPLATRADHGQLALADGRVLLVGGRPIAGEPAPLALEWYEPQSQRFVASAAELTAPIWRPGIARLHDGRVLVCGGVGPGGSVSSAAYLYDPSTDQLEALPPMDEPRVLHSVNVLADGSVLVAGGTASFDDLHPLGLPASLQGPLSRHCRRFDPIGKQWLVVPDLPAPRMGHATTAMADGTVLISGGIGPAPGGPLPSSSVWTGDGLGPWTSGGPLLEPRAFHAQVDTVDGDLLIAGGAQLGPGGLGLVGLPSSERYEVQSNASFAGPGSMGLVIDGKEVCIPGPVVTKFPGTQPTTTFGDGPPVGPVIVYYVVGGLELEPWPPPDSAAGAVSYRHIAGTNSWVAMSGGVDVGPGQRVTAVDGGLRLLHVGPAGAVLFTVK
ncbi:hypothetical protein [Engelhardtia mirabilis]|uniref:Kelch motif protein n=1 Tax=Engelhardtia mirabilis TaxID=2528011 RepID=A0A518BSE0_9BACT|nr:Kelch motif protein [Planctomycetes bacterium Pla133]QDV04216.1 Kelch motif protein [Planctomycetes bacterium Pla86]